MSMMVNLLPVHAVQAEETAKRKLENNLLYSRIQTDKMLEEGEEDELFIVLRDDNHEDYEYQWEYRSFNDREKNVWEEIVQRGDESIFTIESMSEVDSGEYRCKIWEKNGEGTAEVIFSRSMKVDISWYNNQWNDEYDYYALPGDELTLELTDLEYDSDYTVQYRWWFEDTLLEGETGASFEPNLRDHYDFGTYRCEVNLMKDDKIVSIKSQIMYVMTDAYIYTLYNREIYRRLGKTVELEVYIFEDDMYPEDMTLTYQWQRYDEETGEAIDIPGAEESAYSLKINTEEDYGIYRCILKGMKNSVVAYEELCDIRVLQKIEMWMDYDSSFIAPNESETVSAYLDGDTEGLRITYQWYKGSMEEEDKIIGATNSSFPIKITDNSDYDIYYCEAVIYDGAVQLYKSNCSLEVHNTFFRSFIDESSHENPNRIILKDSVTLVAPEIHSDKYDEYNEFSYQWYKMNNGSYQAIEGATSDRYTIDPISEDNEGDRYYVEAFLNIEGKLWSCNTKSYFVLNSDIGLEKGEDIGLIYFRENGKVRTMESHVTCSPQFEDKLTYQWMGWNEEDFEDQDPSFTKIKGANSKTFTPTRNQAMIYDYYQCVVSVDLKGFPDIFAGIYAIWDVNQVVDLTKEEYTGSVSSEFFYEEHVTKIKGSEDAKGIQFTLRDNSYSGDTDFALIDNEGHLYEFGYYSYVESITLKGNIAYAWVSYYSDTSKSGISKVESVNEFERKAYMVESYESPDNENYTYGDTIDLTGLKARRYYNDGTTEEIDFEDLSCETYDTKKLGRGEYSLTITDSVSGLSFGVYIYIEMFDLITFDKQPPEVMFAKRSLTYTTKLSEQAASTELNYLWMIQKVDENGMTETVNFLGDDTSSTFNVPESLGVGNYIINCYYYLEEEEFNEYQYITSELAVIGETMFILSDKIPESTHPITQNTRYSRFMYHIPNAERIALTFDERTDLYYDAVLYILGQDGTGYSYDTEELAGQTIEAEGDTVYVYAYYPMPDLWGYKVTEIKAVSKEPLVTESPGVSEPPPTNPPALQQQESPKTSTLSPSSNPDLKKGKTAKAKIGKLTAKKRAMIVKLKKISGAKGYQISYSTNKKFKKSVKRVTSKKTKITIKKLRSNVKYYVKARGYKTNQKGKKVYGKYSKVKSIIIK
jgi:hypothetical protein